MLPEARSTELVAVTVPVTLMALLELSVPAVTLPVTVVPELRVTLPGPDTLPVMRLPELPTLT